MSFNMKSAAENLLKIADAIEKEASEVTYYVCSKCNHTANLATINETRSKIASEGGYDKVSKITIHDKIACPACSGLMEYIATEDSEKYYIEVDAAGDDGTGIGMEPVDVDTDTGREGPMPPMNKKKSPVEGEPAPEETPTLEGTSEEGAPQESAPNPIPSSDGTPAPNVSPNPAPMPESDLSSPTPEGDLAPKETPESAPQEGTPEGGTSEEGAPQEGISEEGAPEEKTPESIFQPVDEQQKSLEDQKDMEGPEEGEENEDGGSGEGEGDGPKFTEMPEDLKQLNEEQKKKGPGRPKQAGERFWGSVARYASNS